MNSTISHPSYANFYIMLCIYVFFLLILCYYRCKDYLSNKKPDVLGNEDYYYLDQNIEI